MHLYKGSPSLKLFLEFGGVVWLLSSEMCGILLGEGEDVCSFAYDAVLGELEAADSPM